jgi:hypothetical protein
MKSGARLRAAIPAGSHRLAVRLQDVTLLQRTSALIADLGVQLDQQLAAEQRPAERMRMLRETTNRITRAANDAVNAYARTSRALREELARPNADVRAANAIRVRIDAARRDVLHSLDEAKQRYLSPDEPMSDPEPEPESGA